MFPHKLFLLSPANCAGERAKLLFNRNAQFNLARRLHSNAGASLGEIFAFLSGLYFRGKLTYAQHFAAPPQGMEGSLIITSNRGLLPPQTQFDLAHLRALGEVPIDSRDLRYREPLERSTRQIAAQHPDLRVILLGSVASGKYVDVLLDVFGARLHFPADFVGRGDMSRGGLMLRSVESGQELSYVPVSGAIVRGKRAPRLQKR